VEIAPQIESLARISRADQDAPLYRTLVSFGDLHDLAATPLVKDRTALRPVAVF
jgi:hypothetical protein